jgi:hypothetical protein
MSKGVLEVQVVFPGALARDSREACVAAWRKPNEAHAYAAWVHQQDYVGSNRVHQDFEDVSLGLHHGGLLLGWSGRRSR